MNELFADRSEVSYSDKTEITVISLLFGLALDGGGWKQRVLMDQAVAKKLALLLCHTVKSRERIQGKPIPVDEDFYKRVGIAPEDFLL